MFKCRICKESIGYTMPICLECEALIPALRAENATLREELVNAREMIGRLGKVAMVHPRDIAEDFYERIERIDAVLGDSNEEGT